MKLFDNRADEIENLKNRSRFFKKLGIDLKSVVATVPHHGTNIVTVTAHDTGKKLLDLDGLITQEPNITLTFTVADCFPVYFFDPTTNVIGLIHAGWRSTIANIIDSAIASLKSAGANIATLLAAIGPGIQQCHFEILPEHKKNYSSYPGAAEEREGKVFVSLPLVLQQQLNTSGISDDRINTSTECTHCLQEQYFSWRRDHPEKLETMVAYCARIA